MGGTTIRDRITGLRRVRAGDLLPNPRNWRTHPKHQSDALRGLLDEIGWADALIARELDDGRLELIDGHLRAGMDADAQVPVLVLDVTQAEADKVLATLDPLAALAGMNGEALTDLEARVTTENEAVRSLLDRVFASARQAKFGFADDKDPPTPAPPKKAITRLGDVWTLGTHRLTCGDARDAAVWRRVAMGKRPVCFTSPPYNLGTGARLSGNRARSAAQTPYVGSDDKRTEAEHLELLQAMLDVALSECSVAVFNVQPLAKSKRPLITWLSRNVARLVDIVTWDKGNAAPSMADGVLTSQYEWLVIFAAKQNASRRVPLASWRGTMPSVYNGPPQRSNDFAAVHGATFPIHLPLWVLGKLVDRADVLVDCCVGTGTALIAAERLGRRCAAIEIEPSYCDVVVERWQRETGKKATRAAGARRPMSKKRRKAKARKR